MRRLRSRRAGGLIALAVLALTAGSVAACGDDSGAKSSGPVTLRLGYFPNITHATPIVGVEKGIFAEKLGSGVKLETKTFNAGPAAVEAIFSGAIDAAYVGPGPTINAFSKSNGQAIKVISGAASGGAALVVKPTINTAADLKGKKLASPQLGNTQDIALRYWLKQQGLTATKEGGGDVKVTPQENAQTVETFASGAIDGAWVPEPYVTKMVNAGGKVLVDEKSLWPDGKFVVTNLIVSTKFLKAHPDAVKKLVEGQVAANAFIKDHTDEAQQAVSTHIGKITGKPLDIKLVQAAWKNLEYTDDPIASSLKAGLDHAVAVELTKAVDLNGLYDLTYLNEVLKEHGESEVAKP